MSEQRAWEVGDGLVRRHDGRRGTVVATRVDVLFSGFEGLVVVSLGENCVAATQSTLEKSDGWELREGLEQR